MHPATRPFFLAVVFLLAAPLMALPDASAAPETSYARVSKLYSTMEGWWQAIELELVTVNSSPLALGGRTLTVRDRWGNVRTTQALSNKFDGPIQRPYLLLANFADDWFDGIESVNADLQVDPRLPIEGGSIEIEGMDAWTFGPLPLTGMHALARDGSVVPSILNRYLRDPYSDTIEYTAIADRAGSVALEYYHAGMDHYFLTALASEQELLDSGQIPGWKRTGLGLQVFARAASSVATSKSAPVCRFLKDYPDGYSHVLSSVAAECTWLEESGFGTLESAAVFHVAAADAITGQCPDEIWVDYPLAGETATFPASRPVYRLWNGKSEANHRFVSGKYERNEMVAKGWISEGYGTDGVAFCGNGE